MKLRADQWTRSFRTARSTKAFPAAKRSATKFSRWPILEPTLAVLDETDSGLDIDALPVVAEGVNALRSDGARGQLVVTHYQRLLNYLVPDFVHVLVRRQASPAPETRGSPSKLEKRRGTAGLRSKK